MEMEERGALVKRAGKEVTINSGKQVCWWAIMEKMFKNTL